MTEPDQPGQGAYFHKLLQQAAVTEILHDPACSPDIIVRELEATPDERNRT